MHARAGSSAQRNRAGPVRCSAARARRARGPAVRQPPASGCDSVPAASRQRIAAALTGRRQCLNAWRSVSIVLCLIALAGARPAGPRCIEISPRRTGTYPGRCCFSRWRYGCTRSRWAGWWRRSTTGPTRPRRTLASTSRAWPPAATSFRSSKHPRSGRTTRRNSTSTSPSTKSWQAVPTSHSCPRSAPGASAPGISTTAWAPVSSRSLTTPASTPR